MPRRRAGKRIAITLACVDCKSRNYQTTKRSDQQAVELKKFCRTCGRHSLHRETK